MKTDTAEDWLSRLDDARKEDGMEKYDNRCHAIREKYRYEGSKLIRTRKYQMLWANTQTMQSAVYSKPPHAVVSRRYRDPDPVARTATEVLERAINFSFDASDFDTEFKMVRDDFLLYSRGVARIYYEREYETENDLNEDLADALDDSSNEPGMANGAANYGLRPESGPGNYQIGARAGLAGNISLPGIGLRGPNQQTGYGSGELGYADQGEPNGERGRLKFENVRIRFVQRFDFRHQPARTWSEVTWVAFRAFLTKEEVTARFGSEIGDNIEFDADPLAIDDLSERESRSLVDTGTLKAAIWEIWDKAKKEVVWISPGYPDILESGPPYLDLDGFYPCPRPAFGTVTTDSLIPVPDFVFYQDQADEIDQLTARIAAVSDALKLVGFYPGGPQGEGSPEIEKAMAPGFENKMIAVRGWASFIEGGGGKGVPIEWLPIEQAMAVIEGCVKTRQQLVEDVYQIIGISDIMRGATDPQETEGAQQLKAQYGGTRIRDRQEEIARFCRDISRLTGQVIAKYCSPQTIMAMTGVNLPTRAQVMLTKLLAQAQPPPQPNGGGQPASPQQPTLPQKPPPTPVSQEDVFELLKNDLLRRFKIDIETDSTIAGDESQEKQDRQGFIQSMTAFMEAWGPMVMQKPELAPLAGQLLLFGVRAFRVGRELEETIEETVENLQSQQQGPPQPDPKVQAETLKLQGTQARTQSEVQKATLDAQSEQASASAKMQGIQQQAFAKMAELRMKLALAEQEHAHSMQQAQVEQNAAVQKAQIQQMPKWPIDPNKLQGF